MNGLEISLVVAEVISRSRWKCAFNKAHDRASLAREVCVFTAFSNTSIIRMGIRLRPTSLRPSKVSTTSIGLAYELATLAFLSRPPLSFKLQRVGGKNDHGVDLRGFWNVPLRKIQQQPDDRNAALGRGSTRCSVIVQCKAETQALGPSVVRELEGTVAFEDLSLNPASAGKDKKARRTVGLLASQSGFSREALLRAQVSTFPLFLLEINFSNPELRPVPSSTYTVSGAPRMDLENGFGRLIPNDAFRCMMNGEYEDGPRIRHLGSHIAGSPSDKKVDS